jgi:hypothetical protein
MQFARVVGLGLVWSAVCACSGPSQPAAVGDAGLLVTECQAAANNFATLCAGSDPRPCLWNAYAKLCGTGQTQLLVDSMKCLDNTTCRTFSDPNQGESCLAQLHAANETQVAKAAIQSSCNTCGGSSCSTVTGTAEILPYLTDADLSAFASCNGNACNKIASACSSNESIAPFVACGF